MQPTINDLHYVTPTLFNSWQYYMNSEQDREEFLKILKREPIPITQSIQAGITFEKAVTDIAKTNITIEGLQPSEFKCAQELADIVRGGYFQEVLKLKLTPEIVLYGKADVIKGPKIYDIKRVSNYEPGKYSDSIQHQIYMLIAHISDFDYLICDGSNVYIESYWYPSFSDLEEIVKARINEFINWLKTDNDFFNTYLEHWSWRGKL